jgi:ABC-type Fe3+ transport system permease subunit
MNALVDVQAADGLPRARAPALIGAVTLLLIAGPFITLAFATHWSDFHFAAGDTGSFAVSLGYSLIALVLIVILGSPLAWWLARHSFSRQVAAGSHHSARAAHAAARDGHFAHHFVRSLRPGGQPGNPYRH